MNYKIIQDKQKLLDFIEWLPELKPNENFYYCLFARNKYIRGTIHEQYLKADKAQLKRGTSKKDYLFDKIKQLEVEFGSYKQNGYEIPQESLALYINPNPRSERKAMKLLLTKGLELIINEAKGFSCQSEALSAIQQSCSRKLFLDFDFDNSNFEDYKEAIENQVSGAYKVLVTRGGFHLLVTPSLIKNNKRWYEVISNWEAVDKTNHTDCLLPVPGCCQGGFVPYFYEN